MSEARAYLRAREIAERIGVDVRTVRRWIAAGTLPSVKIGGARLVPKVGLERLLAPAPDVTEGVDRSEAEVSESQAFIQVS